MDEHVPFRCLFFIVISNI